MTYNNKWMVFTSAYFTYSKILKRYLKLKAGSRIENEVTPPIKETIFQLKYIICWDDCQSTIGWRRHYTNIECKNKI